MIVAPSLHLLIQAVADNLKRYVSRGGIRLLTQRTGVKDESNAVVNQRLPGLLGEVWGVEVEEYDSLHTNMHNEIKFNLPELDCTEEFTVGVLCDILRPTTASVVASYTHDYYAGRPAITCNQYGKGQAIYVGALGNERLYDVLAGWMIEITGLKPCITVPTGY